MKIEYRLVGASMGYSLLFDEAAGTATVKEFRPRATISKQNVALATTPSQVNSTYKQPLGNVTESFTLEVVITYTTANVADRGLALQQARVLKTALLTSKNNLKVTEPTGTAEVQWYPNAVCSSFEFAIDNGCTVTYNMQFEADLVTTVEPA